ncbi:cytochrome c [Niabella yanshanensis]|uniref:Cytochrome c n=1 Tax=Niabella yanshanensis TaxID=577386 RepID=A0ABZ0W1M4_9BACT|nr:cytochrome c [Niabella yanshanensis]WQD36553.1 cytochrome c [Niabella yanshanensis]
MNKYFYIAVVVLSAVAAGCGAGKEPGIAYMPDMYYSKAYETYASTKELKDSGIYYNRLPVAGTVSTDEDLAFHFNLKHDSTGYAQSASLKNPLDSGATVNLKEAERLYLVNCGICHGAALDGNGPLFKGGEGPYSAKPATLVGDAVYEAMAPGTMFYSITYGKGQMGSYASQLTPKERWEVVAYIKSKQKKAAPAAAPAAAAPVDSTATAKK